MKYRVTFRQKRWCVQRQTDVGATNCITGGPILRWRTIARWPFRLLAKLHLVWLRERGE